MDSVSRLKSIIFCILKYLFIGTVTTISLLPLVWIFISSFKTDLEIFSTPLALPSEINFNGYVMALEISPIAQFYKNSVVIAFLGTFLNIAIFAMSAYVLARFKFRIRGIVIAMLSVSLLLPITALMQPIYIIIKALGLYDTKTALILVYITLGLPTTLYILRSYYLTISKDIEESAYIDGAGFLRTFISIVAPIAVPGYATAAILQFLLCWQEFTFALILTTGNKNRTLPIALQYFTNQFNYNYTAMFAAIIMIIIPSLLIFVLLQEQVISGLTAGAVKG